MRRKHRKTLMAVVTVRPVMDGFYTLLRAPCSLPTSYPAEFESQNKNKKKTHKLFLKQVFNDSPHCNSFC